MTRKLTLFLVCAFEITLILFVATAAKSFDAGTHKLQLACRTTHVVTVLSGGSTAMSNYSFNITVNKHFIEFGANTLKREPSSISSKVFGYGHGALPHYDDEKARANGFNISRTLEIFQDPESFVISYVFADTNYAPTLSTGKCNKK